MSGKKTPVEQYKYERPPARVQDAFGSFAAERQEEDEERAKRRREEQQRKRK